MAQRPSQGLQPSSPVLPPGDLRLAPSLRPQPGQSSLPRLGVVGWPCLEEGLFLPQAESSPFWPPERPQGRRAKGEEKGRSQQAGRRAQEERRRQGGEKGMGRLRERPGFWGSELSCGDQGQIGVKGGSSRYLWELRGLYLPETENIHPPRTSRPSGEAVGTAVATVTATAGGNLASVRFSFGGEAPPVEALGGV